MNPHHVPTVKERTEGIKALAEVSREKLKEDVERERRRLAWPLPRQFLYAIVNKHWFEMACGVVILFNLLLVVRETDAGVDDGETPFWVVAATKCLLVIYTVELVSKLYVYRLEFFYEMWNVLDFGIVGMDLVFTFISLFGMQLPNLSILRVFRLVRLARAFKAAKSFRELNSLLRACTCALKAIFWGMVLLSMALTVWGILAVQLIHPVNKKIAETTELYHGCERCPRAFSTVFDSILTFWKQLVAGDSWGTLCEPIVEEAPWTFVFFVFVLVTVNLTMLNCILAVVVEAGAAATAADEHDQAMQREKQVFKAEGKLIDLCQGLDSDDSGSLNITEFIEGYGNNTDFRECLEVMHVTESDMFMIFNICDEDDSGDVDYREFVEQLRRIKHSGEQMLLHYVTNIRHVVNKIRPECLKSPPISEVQPDGGEEKYNESKMDGRVQDSPANPASDQCEAVTIGNFLVTVADGEVKLRSRGPFEYLGDGGKSNDSDTPDAKIKETNADPGQTRSENIGDILRMEKLESIFKINEQLVTSMADAAQQSKLQMGLLNTLVKAFGHSVRSIKDPSSGLKEPATPDPDIVRLSENTAARTANVLPTVPRGVTVGCCLAGRPPPMGQAV